MHLFGRINVYFPPPPPQAAVKEFVESIATGHTDDTGRVGCILLHHSSVTVGPVRPLKYNRGPLDVDMTPKPLAPRPPLWGSPLQWLSDMMLVPLEADEPKQIALSNFFFFLFYSALLVTCFGDALLFFIA